MRSWPPFAPLPDTAQARGINQRTSVSYLQIDRYIYIYIYICNCMYKQISYVYIYIHVAEMWIDKQELIHQIIQSAGVWIKDLESSCLVKIASLDDSLFAQAPQGALGLVKRLFRLETTSLADFCTCNAQRTWHRNELKGRHFATRSNGSQK